MKLTGTLEERIAAALEFAKAHRAFEYDHDAFVERYRRAGVPYTEAAERFCREWDGVLDGTIRDLASLRGTYRIIPETAEAVGALLSMLTEMEVASAHILLDQPVSNSGRLKTLMAELKEAQGERCPLNLDIQILKEVDKALWEKENVITSDSIILDHCKSWCNMMKKCVEKYGAKTLQVW